MTGIIISIISGIIIIPISIFINNVIKVKKYYNTLIQFIKYSNDHNKITNILNIYEVNSKLKLIKKTKLKIYYFYNNIYDIKILNKIIKLEKLFYNELIWQKYTIKIIETKQKYRENLCNLLYMDDVKKDFSKILNNGLDEYKKELKEQSPYNSLTERDEQYSNCLDEFKEIGFIDVMKDKYKIFNYLSYIIIGLLTFLLTFLFILILNNYIQML